MQSSARGRLQRLDGIHTRKQVVSSGRPSVSRRRIISNSLTQLANVREADKQPPDLASFLFSKRIIYMGAPMVIEVIELILAELLYLQIDKHNPPATMYINSIGCTYNPEKRLGFELAQFTIYDTMMYVKYPIHTLCIGNAWGEAAVCLMAGKQGRRAALPSSSIMIRPPLQTLMNSQASDIDAIRHLVRGQKREMAEVIAKHTGKPVDVVALHLQRPRYMNAYESVEYAIIDEVLESSTSVFRRVDQKTSTIDPS